MSRPGHTGNHARILAIIRRLGLVFWLSILATAQAHAQPDPKDSTAAADEVVVDNAGDIWDQEGAEWPRWSAHDDASRHVIDYGAWTVFVRDFSNPNDPQGALDYVRVAAKGMGYLRATLVAFQAVPVSKLNRNEQLAFWFNLHNAAAVWATAAALPLEDDTARALVMGARWRDKTIVVEGESLSLVDISRRIVMRQWPDARVLYGLHLPIQGAPGLPRTPFTGATVWNRLDERAREFVNSDRALEIHGNQLHVSALYFWDRWLIPSEQQVIQHLRSFAAPELRGRLARFETVTATYLNWRVSSYNSGYDPNQDRRTGS